MIILSLGHLAWGSVERAQSARSTASTGPIVTVRITLISDPDTRIYGALMAASVMHPAFFTFLFTFFLLLQDTLKDIPQEKTRQPLLL